MAFEVNRAVGQLKNTIWCNRGCTVEAEVIAREAGVDELITGGSGQGCMIYDQREEEVQKEG